MMRKSAVFLFAVLPLVACAATEPQVVITEIDQTEMVEVDDEADPVADLAAAIAAETAADEVAVVEVVPAAPVLAPPQGLRNSRLFDDSVTDTTERLDRLEQAVQAVRDDVDLIVAAPVVAKAAPVETAAPVVAKTSPMGVIKGLRMADHADKTRIVLDMTTACKTCTPLLSEDAKTLVVPIENMTWAGKTVWHAKSGKLVSGYKVQEGLLYVTLLEPAKIKDAEMLPAGQGVNHVRLVIDLIAK